MPGPTLENSAFKKEPVESPRAQPVKRQKVVDMKATVGASENPKSKGVIWEQFLARARLTLPFPGISERLAAIRLHAVVEKVEEGAVALVVDLLMLSFKAEGSNNAYATRRIVWEVVCATLYLTAGNDTAVEEHSRVMRVFVFHVRSLPKPGSVIALPAFETPIASKNPCGSNLFELLAGLEADAFALSGSRCRESFWYCTRTKNAVEDSCIVRGG